MRKGGRSRRAGGKEEEIQRAAARNSEVRDMEQAKGQNGSISKFHATTTTLITSRETIIMRTMSGSGLSGWGRGVGGGGTDP